MSVQIQIHQREKSINEDADKLEHPLVNCYDQHAMREVLFLRWVLRIKENVGWQCLSRQNIVSLYCRLIRVITRFVSYSENLRCGAKYGAPFKALSYEWTQRENPGFVLIGIKLVRTVSNAAARLRSRAFQLLLKISKLRQLFDALSQKYNDLVALILLLHV